MGGTFDGLVGSLVCSPAEPEGVRADVEDLPVEVGHSGVDVDEMLVDSLVEVLSTHFYFRYAF